MICDNCGANINETDKFCSQCGTANGTRANTQINLVENSHIGNFVVYDDRNDRVIPGDYVQVIDNVTKCLIMQGEVKNEKLVCTTGSGTETFELSDDQRLLTLDNKYFFRLDDSKYTVKRLPKLFFEQGFVRKNYEVRTWRSVKEKGPENADIFMDYSIEELDKEVESIVYTLNRFSLDMETEASCSGHDKLPAYVQIQFNNPRVLGDFLEVFEPFKEKMTITTASGASVTRQRFEQNAFFPGLIAMHLRTKEVGEPAYKTLDEFDEYLNGIIEFRNKAFNELDNLISQAKIKHLSHRDL